MSAVNLFTGIAVVIDDEIGEESANISNLIRQIEKRKMPCLKYNKLPELGTFEHFAGVSFILLDWKLNKGIPDEKIIAGVGIPESVSQQGVDDNINFLKNLRKYCFSPIFIFTNEHEAPILKVLRENGLYQDKKPNYIFVKKKGDLKGRTRLFKILAKWVQKTPSVSVLSAWEKSYGESKVKLFYDFYNLSPNWPRILWKTFADDGVNMSIELGDIITRNLHTRMLPFNFDNESLDKRGRQIAHEEIRKVLEGERFIGKDRLDDQTICTGDLFKIESKIFINIRPDCDCILRNKTGPTASDDLDLYLLEGARITAAQERKKYNKKYGNFEEIDNESIVFTILDGKTFSFKFKNMIIKKWLSVKDNRIGRLLPPYITRMQQRYALYLQRQGLPRIPELAVFAKKMQAKGPAKKKVK